MGFNLINRSEKLGNNNHSSVTLFCVTFRCTAVFQWTSFPFLCILRFLWLRKCNISKEVAAIALMFEDGEWNCEVLGGGGTVVT